MMKLTAALSDLTVLDIGMGMAAALVSKFLAEAGAKVVRLAPMEGDLFDDVYPAQRMWRGRASVQRISGPEDPLLAETLAKADVCICGGEDHPEMQWRFDAAALQAAHPGLVVLELTGYPPGHPAPGPAVEVLLQAASGVAFEHYTDRPLRWAFQAVHHGTALQALVGTLAALYGRDRDGRGQRVSVSLFEGAVTWALGYWHEASEPAPPFEVQIPKDPCPLIFRCRDGVYIQVVIGSTGSKGRLYQLLGIDDPAVGPNDSGAPTLARGPRLFWGDVDVLATHVAQHDSAPLLEALWAADIGADLVLAPGAIWDDVQVRHNSIIDATADGTRFVGFPLGGEIRGAAPAAPPTPEAGRGPLSGVRALDFGIFVAGPFATVPLADLGAEVIKVEALEPESFRQIYGTFASVNRSKRSIAINMKTPQGQEIVQRLIASASLLTSNFRPGVSFRLGLGEAAVMAANPRAVVLETSGYGGDGPKSLRTGLDMIFQAVCGHEVRAGGEGNPPLWFRTPIVDYACGLLGTIGSLLALRQSRLHGGGAVVKANLLNAGLYLMSDLVQQPDGQFIGAAMLNRQQTGLHPTEAFYEARDGWVAIAALGDAMAWRLAQALELSACMGPVPARWSTEEADHIASACRGHTVEALMARLEQADVWAARCEREGQKMLREPGLAAQVFRGRNAVHGDIRQIGPLCRLSAAPPCALALMPEHGEHTREILEELGYSAEGIDALYAANIVR